MAIQGVIFPPLGNNGTRAIFGGKIALLPQKKGRKKTLRLLSFITRDLREITQYSSNSLILYIQKKKRKNYRRLNHHNDGIQRLSSPDEGYSDLMPVVLWREIPAESRNAINI